MRFMVMHKSDAKMESGAPPEERILREMGSLVQGALKSGVMLDGAGLHRSARRLRVTFAGGAKSIERGPLSGGNQLIAGATMITAKSEDDAVDQASKLAAAVGDCEIEIGPVVEPWDLGVMAKPDNAPLRFLLLRKGDASTETGAPTPKLDAAVEQLRRDGTLVAALTLAPSAKGSRSRVVSGRRQWTDGPFSESKELIAGYCVLDLPSLAVVKPWAEQYGAILGDLEIDIRELVG
jgi:hypothetical protein